MPSLTIEQAMQIARQHHQAGQLSQAEALYRQVLQQQPDHVEALHLLGVVACQVGRHEVAEVLIGRAIALKPNYAEAYGNLGNVRKEKGQLDAAIAAYHQAIALKPNHAEAYGNLGIVLQEKGQLEAAIAAYHRAIALNPRFAEAYSNLGNALQDQGQFDAAVAAYHQAIALRPNYPEAHSNLGNALQAQGQFDAAVAAYHQAIALRPAYAEAYGNLGNALQAQGRLDEAIAAYRQAIARKPNMAEAHNNLGNVLHSKGQHDEAIAAHRQAIALRPDFAEAYSNLGNALKDKRQLEEAIAAYRQAIALDPNYPEAHYNLGLTLQAQGRLDEAIAAYRQAIAGKPNLPEAFGNMGNALQDKRQFAEAIAAYRQAIALKPNYPAVFSNLGNALQAQEQLAEAIAAYRQAIALKPSFAEAYSNLGSALAIQGQLDEAVAAYRHAMALDPANAVIHSNLVFTLHFHPAYDAQALASEQHQWYLRHAEPLQTLIQPHANDRTAERRLRIGYVSADFQKHVVGRNMMPLFRHMDREGFEAFCYSGVRVPDALTEEFRRQATMFRAVSGMTDEALAEQIRADEIDILVDLALHMAGNRMLAMARKPAPVQATFAGYPGTTGLETIDYRLTDPYLDPPGEGADGPHAEKPLRLPATFWCYDPLDDAPPAAGALPALANGYVTFGCLNNFCKVNEGVLKRWALVLRSVPNSRLVMLTGEGTHRQQTLRLLEAQGVASGRVRFAAKLPHADYLQLYQQIDIGLDTAPYNGHTTSLDSFFMGVPVVTLVGQTVVGRAGLSQLMNLGMPELVGRTDGEFVKIARDLAADLGRLAALRAGLRGRMQGSPLMDGAGFARGIEAAYREMWREWCARG